MFLHKLRLFDVIRAGSYGRPLYFTVFVLYRHLIPRYRRRTNVTNHVSGKRLSRNRRGHDSIDYEGVPGYIVCHYWFLCHVTVFIGLAVTILAGFPAKEPALLAPYPSRDNLVMAAIKSPRRYPRLPGQWSGQLLSIHLRRYYR